MFKLREMLEALHAHDVQFIIVGGVAASAHGSSHATQDLDLCYAGDDDNLERLSRALQPYRLRLRARGAPEGVPFVFDAEPLWRGAHFTMTTTLGDIDLLAHVLGVGTFEDMWPSSVAVTLCGHTTRILGLADLIQAKEATGQQKDNLQLPELRALKKKRRGDQPK